MLEFKILHNLILRENAQKSDAIIWLQGDRYDRASKVFKLYKEGWAKKIIISGNNVLIGSKKRMGEKNISLDKMKNYLLKKGVEGRFILVDNNALNTKEQAEHIIKIAVNKRWSKLIIVGSSYYQPRAFLTFFKQAEKLKWVGRIINQPVIIDWRKKPSGRDKVASLLFKEEFKKINKYKKDLAPIERGIKYLNKKDSSLRGVQKNDLRLLFKWANDADVRANAKNSKPIAWAEHVAWFNNKLSDKSAHIYILVNLENNIGFVRFEKIKKEFEISYAIDRNYRGQGYGILILKEGLKKIRKIYSYPSLSAHVKKGNIASEKIFEKLGFILKKEEVINNIKFNIYKK